MESNNINIIIIHTSEIIRTGLSEITGKCCDNNIEAVNDLSAIDGYPNILGCHLVIVPKIYFTENKELVKRIFLDAQSVEYLLINENNTESDENSFSIFDSAPALCIKVSERIKRIQNKNKHTEELTLSTRETDVLKLITKGLTNKEIASTLFISPHTVITHRKNISAKLNIKSVSGLTVYAVLKKIINIDEINPEELI